MAEEGASWQLEFEKVEQRCAHLLKSGLLSDCTFLVGSESNQSEEVSAHKLVLAMASPVFEEMFYGGGLPEHNEPSKPKISDIQPEVFRALLQYIYTGNTDIGSFNMAWGLFYGAKKYSLPHLVKKCNRYICSVLAPSNACRAYELARLYDEKTLMDKCIQIISKNTKEVLKNNSFKDVKFNTMITVFSLDYLTVDSELDLFYAVVKYAEAEQKKQGQISHVDEGPPSNKLSELRLEPSTLEEKVMLSVESTSQTSPADSKTLTEVTTSKPTVNKENLKEVPEGRRFIRAALRKIRFLTMTPEQFAEAPARSGLLTNEESFALLMNIASRVSGVPMPTGFSESREPRGGDPDEEEKFAEPRPKLDTESRGFTKFFVAEIVRGLLPPDPAALEESAHAARLMTCADAYGISENITQLVEAGGIPPLVAALADPRTGVQYDAAWALTNIACDDKHIDALINAHAVTALVGLLDGGGAVAEQAAWGGAVAEQAAWALGNIAGSGDTACEAVVHAGAIAALLAHMQPTTPCPPLGTYMRTLRIISQTPSCSYTVRGWSRSPCRIGLIPAAAACIENLLVIDNEQVLADACMALPHLPSGEGFSQHPYTPNLVARITALLGHAAPRVQAAALCAIMTTLDVTELRDVCLEAGCLDHILNLLKSEKTSVVKYAAIAIGYILNGKPLQNQQAVDERILDALGAVLTEGSDKCKLIAVHKIRSICTEGSVSQLTALAEGATLEPYCRLLDVGDFSYYVCDGLCYLLERSDENKVAPLVLKLRQFGVPQLLLPFLPAIDHNYYYRTDVEFLMEKYFPDDVTEYFQDKS